MTDLAGLDREVMWHPFTQMRDWEPLVIVEGDGNYLIDSAGRRYLDGVSSLWCNVHGHRHPRLDRALRDQLDRIAHSTFLGHVDAHIGLDGKSTGELFGTPALGPRAQVTLTQYSMGPDRGLKFSMKVDPADGRPTATSTAPARATARCRPGTRRRPVRGSDASPACLTVRIAAARRRCR